MQPSVFQYSQLRMLLISRTCRIVRSAVLALDGPSNEQALAFFIAATIPGLSDVIGGVAGVMRLFSLAPSQLCP